jgi:DNA-binding transcriptional LysR family regulator
MDWFCRSVLTELAVYRHAVKTGSPKAAHEGLVKTPAAIGQSIRRMEEHLSEWLNGGGLTDQLRKKTIQPSEAGRIVYEFAEAILNDSDTFLERLYAFQNDTQVRLACITSAWMTYGLKWQAEFEKRVDGGTIIPQLIGGDGYPQKILDAVAKGDADAGITNYPPKPNDRVVYEPFVDRELKLVFSAKYPHLPKGDNPVNVGPVISQDNKLKIAIHRRAVNSQLGQQVLYYFQHAGAYMGPQQLLEVENVEEIKGYIRRFPMLISILPEDVIAADIADGIFKAYTLEPKTRDWKWGLYYRVGTSRPHVLQLLECFRPLFKRGSHKKLRKS